MCPECFTTAAIIFAGATSTGGLGALVMKKLGFKELSRFAKSPDEPTQNQAQENSMPEVLASARIADHKIVSPDQWLEHRKQLLAKEKELTRLRDEINRERLELPWEKVEKQYTFESTQGRETLGDLFAGRSQLIVYHFMLGPGWKEGCVGCSFLADHIGGALVHLENHDVSLVVVSRAPLAEIEAYKKRMGWNFKWVSSNGSDFNYDYHVSFTPEQAATGKVYYNYDDRDFVSEELAGASAFYTTDSSEIFHTYSNYARGGEMFLGTYNFLDIAPKGRNETGPRFDMGDWLRHHDRYAAAGHVDATGRRHEEKSECCHGEQSH
jgi:predicted dithiol-disulfide oxidoreductase (DUF899 family)